ncbi:hypothetical protein SAMN04487914_108133 [Arthrobacter sp. ok909]|uniref:hypothetical protein n=1 Tax=Arthrobacter sp. ok909 TaxID=1761746 RepID=UPI00088FBE09|nr:hypothetical protein [Arthrobacter sp. ok909]SDP34035.1 hypothetical protein SAMN04487914_108133 [Arthrobacter sp. ok909]
MSKEVEGSGNEWVYRGADMSRSDALVPYNVQRAELSRAWTASYRARRGADITQDAGNGLADVRNRFNELNRKDPGIGQGLAIFEANYIAGAATIIAKYTMEDD